MQSFDMLRKCATRRRFDTPWNGVAKISEGYAMFCLAKEMPYSAKELYRLELQCSCMVSQWIGGAERCEGNAKNRKGTA